MRSSILLRPSVLVSVGLHVVAVAAAFVFGRSTSAQAEREPLWLSFAPSDLESPFEASAATDAEIAPLPEIFVEPHEPAPFEVEPTEAVVDAVPDATALDAPFEPQVAPVDPAPELARLRADASVARRRRSTVALRFPAVRPAVAAPPATARGDQGRLVSPPRPLSTNRPAAYPWEARVRGWQGVATFLVTLRPDGSVAAVVLESSSGHDSLDRAAADAVRGWGYTPPLTEGGPAPVTLRLPIVFRLH